MVNLQNRNNNCGSDRNRGPKTYSAVHLKQNCWAHAPPRPYQTANQNRDGYFCNERRTYNWFGQRETKQQLCNRFAQADIPANCTITGIETDWIYSPDGSWKLEYKLKATLLNKLFHRKTNKYVERSSLRAEWRARMEIKLQGANILGIFNKFKDEAYFDDNSEDGFPHKGMPIFARSKQICQELEAR